MTSMSSKPIVISGVNAVIFHAREKFHRTTTLKNPFTKDSEWYANVTEYTHHPSGAVSIKHVPPKDPTIRPSTQEEKDEWNRAQDAFVAKEILKKCGWDHFEWWCREHNLHDLLNTYNPCDFDGQCSMFCERVGRCNKA